MLVDVVSRWSVLAFASAHVLGLLTHHPVPWSATLTAASLLVVAAAVAVRAATRTLRGLALASGLAAVACLVAEVDQRRAFLLPEAPAGTVPAPVEAALLTTAILTLSTAALLPARERRPRPWGLRRLQDRLRTWNTDRRTEVLDLLESSPSPLPGPATAGPALIDLGTLGPPPASGAATHNRP